MMIMYRQALFRSRPVAPVLDINQKEEYMKDMTRSIRRHHRDRMINRTKKFIKYRWYGEPISEETAYEKALHVHKHRKMCSCAMCGSERKWFKTRTLQEKKAEMDEKNQLFDE